MLQVNEIYDVPSCLRIATSVVIYIDFNRLILSEVVEEICQT